MECVWGLGWGRNIMDDIIIDLSILSHEPEHEYHDQAGKYLTSHLLGDFRKCPLLYFKKTNGLIADEDRPTAIATNYRSTRQLFGRLQCLDTGATRIQYDVLDGQRLLVEDQDAPYVPNPFPPHPPVTTALGENDSVDKRMRAHLLWAAMHFARSSDEHGHSVLISVTEHPEYFAATFLDLLAEDWLHADCPRFFTPPESGRNQVLLARCMAACADYFGPSSREHRLLERGIVLHHGKMPPVMSRLLIELVQARVINIVIATSTLSEGVNLPFETVLIPSLLRQGAPVDAREIANVAGRAGRPGVATEGKTLVLLPSSVQRRSQQAYDRVIASLTGNSNGIAAEVRSPLYALVEHIAQTWEHVSGSNSHEDFITWLETTAYSAAEGDDEKELLTSLDTLDQHLLTCVEERESLCPNTDVEDFLQSLWRNTLARHDGERLGNDRIGQIFTRRGAALVNALYPQRVQRRALYQTGLPPRDGNVLIGQLSEIKAILQEAAAYAAWSATDRIEHFVRLVHATSNIEAFGVRDLNIGRSRIAWRDVLAWWMAPNVSEHTPNPNSVSRWYDFASKHFIYGLNWALGSIIGSVLNRDGGEGDLLDRWRQAALPWAVLWYKDIISWGTLDPVTSYVLARKHAYTRTSAAAVASEYWEGIEEITDAHLEPRHIHEWVRGRLGAEASHEQARLSGQSQFPADLLADFREYAGPNCRVLPLADERFVNWYDPAGYLLARSAKPEEWQDRDSATYDFLLDPRASVVSRELYV